MIVLESKSLEHVGYFKWNDSMDYVTAVNDQVIEESKSKAIWIGIGGKNGQMTMLKADLGELVTENICSALKIIWAVTLDDMIVQISFEKVSRFHSTSVDSSAF